MSDTMDENEFRSTLIKAARYLQQNHPAEAIMMLTPLHDQDPENLDVAINLGGAYILQRKWFKAVSILEPASKTYPDNQMVWMNLAAAYLGTLELSGPAQQQRAIDAYEKVLAIDSRAQNVHYHLGLIYKDQHKYEQAKRYFQEAIQVNPADRDARLWLQRMDGALAELAAGIDPSVPAQDSSIQDSKATDDRELDRGNGAQDAK
ncbi:MAG: tetratricopeptide repeat protein [Chloroflexota bacterium]